MYFPTGASGDYSDATVTMDSTKTVTATYNTQYWVQYAAAVPVTLPANEWVVSGQAATGVFPDPVISGGTKYVFVSDNRPATITAQTTITATYNTFYNVHYAAIGNVLPVNVPADEWVLSGHAATGIFPSQVVNGAGDTRCNFVSDDCPTTITAPTTVTGTYQTQYKLTVSISPIVSPTELSPKPAVSPSSTDGFYDDGKSVTLTAGLVSGYTFNHWEVDGSNQGTSTNLKISMNAKHNAIAFYTFNLAVESGFKSGDSPSFASDPYLSDILCVITSKSGSYTLTGTSPGTFDYAIAIKNTGTTTFTSIKISVTGLSDFNLQSSNPIRVLDANGVDISAQFTISKTLPSITIESKTFQLLYRRRKFS